MALQEKLNDAIVGGQSKEAMNIMAEMTRQEALKDLTEKESNMNEEVALALEDHLEVNPETGEIEGEARPLTNNDLPLIARQMRALESRIGAIKDFRNQEIDRIGSICTEKIDRLMKQMSYFEKLARRMVEQIPNRRVEYPGLGIFRFHKLPDKVNGEKFEFISE